MLWVPVGFCSPWTVPRWTMKGYHAHCCFCFGCDGYEETLHFSGCLCYLWHFLAGVFHPLLIFPPQCFYCCANWLHCIFNLHAIMQLPLGGKWNTKSPSNLLTWEFVSLYERWIPISHFWVTLPFQLPRVLWQLHLLYKDHPILALPFIAALGLFSSEFPVEKTS